MKVYRLELADDCPGEPVNLGVFRNFENVYDSGTWSSEKIHDICEEFDLDPDYDQLYRILLSDLDLYIHVIPSEDRGLRQAVEDHPDLDDVFSIYGRYHFAFKSLEQLRDWFPEEDTEGKGDLFRIGVYESEDVLVGSHQACFDAGRSRLLEIIDL